jgi:tRNA threonylcarbamoyladenosine biosynthesis protein TsaB
MYTLIIETSTEQGVVAILKREKLIQASYLPFGYNQSNHLLPHIQNLFRENNLTPQQIDLIGVGIGPGSYTGIRIGAAVAKTLAYACRKPLVGISSLEAFLPEQYGPFGTIIDAKIGGCYLIQGVWDGKKAAYNAPPRVIPLEQLPETLPAGTVLATPYAQNLKAKIDKIHPHVYPHWIETPPCPLHLGLHALEKYHQGDIVNFDGQLELLYLRETEAEREKNAK